MARKYTTKKVRIRGQTFEFSTREELENLYEGLRPTYNKGLVEYGKGKARYQLQGVGNKSYSYLEKQVRMMARRLNTGVYEQTAGQFKNAFVEALNTHIEIYGDYDSDEVFAVVDIFTKMHHAQFAAFYNSLSPAERGTLFDTTNYYESDGTNASSYAGKTIEKLVEFAKGNKKLQEILEEVAEDYAIMI